MLMIKKKIGTVFEILLEECNIFLNKIGEIFLQKSLLFIY